MQLSQCHCNGITQHWSAITAAGSHYCQQHISCVIHAANPCCGVGRQLLPAGLSPARSHLTYFTGKWIRKITGRIIPSASVSWLGHSTCPFSAFRMVGLPASPVIPGWVASCTEEHPVLLVNGGCCAWPGHKTYPHIITCACISLVEGLPLGHTLHL